MQKSVLEYLERTHQEHWKKTAVIENEKETTFHELMDYSKKLSTLILQNSKAIKSPICVYLPKGTDSIIAFIGILYSGNFYVPLDVNSPESRVSSIISDLGSPDLGSPLVITDRKNTEPVKAMGVDNKSIIQIEEVYGEGIAVDSHEILDRLGMLVDSDPAYIIYTSGSTGKPKGVVISHRSIIDYIDWAVGCFNISSCEIIGSQSPFYFDNSTLDIYLCLAAAAALVIIPEQYFAFPARLMEYVISQNINFIFWVPSVMINVANRKVLDAVNASCLKKILFAGEVMPNKQLNYWRERLPEAVYANLYGPTEITVDCTYYIVNRGFLDNDPLPIGIPCRNTDILILNEDDKPASKGELGELCVRGSSLAMGYWKDFDKSNKVFVQNPLNIYYFDRIYRTGDLVYLNEYNEIVFAGRKDSQIKHMGYRIELGEIENAVLSLNGVDKACVIYNKEKMQIILIYESKREISASGFRIGLADHLPKYMIPNVIYRVEEIPINANGKIDRVRLKEEYSLR